MFKNKFLIFIVLMIALLSMSVASAEESSINATVDDSSTEVVTSEYDENTSLDVASEDNSKLQSKNTIDYTESKDITFSNNDATDTKSFTQLNNTINSSNNVKLDSNYKMTESEANNFVNGITISKNITINGNGFTIDANNLGRIFNIIENSTVTLTNVTLVNGNSTGEGGAIFNNGALTLNNVMLINNTSIDGGTIRNYNNLTIISSVFINNRAVKYGGAIDNDGGFIIMNSTFINNTAPKGGAISNFANSFKVYNSTFINNFANSSGAILNYGFDFIVENSSFINNTASSDPGAIYNAGDGFIVNNSNFINNSATEYGGAIYIFYSGSVEINNCDFKDSEVNWSMIFLLNSEAIIENSRFSNIISNYATALYASISNVTINNSKFTNLTSNKTAGAIGAKAYSGGNSAEICEITITNSEFINISSVKNGGSLFFDSIANVNIINSTFNNSTSMFGGAILQLEGNLIIENSNFTQNTAIYDGGAIYASYVNLTLNNINFMNNRGLNESRGANGGSLYLDMTDARIINSNFINNTVTSDGGAIYTYDSSLFLNNTYFTNNSQFNTTGIYSAFDKNHTAINCNFTDDVISLNNTFYATVVVGTGVTLTLLNNTLILTNFPSRFNLKDFGWVTPVKNQGLMGACWVFGATGSLESALLKATEVEYDFSENNIQNTMIKYSIYGNKNMKEGGEYCESFGYLLNWFGMFSTEYDSYDELGKISSLISTDEKIHIQDVIMIPKRQNATDNNQLKEALIKYGAIGVDYKAQYYEPYYNEDTSAQYYNGTERPDHTVTLVGWDDNYSKDNFIITPPGDGAFIIKNSWGSDKGDEGYLYISYYDTSFATEWYLYGVILNNTVAYNKNYQVDFSGIRAFENFNQSKVWYANQFVAIDDDLIAAVGTYFKNSGENYEISIYVNNELKYTQSGVSTFAGFSTIKLNTYIPIKEGDVFKAVFKGVDVPMSSTTRLHSDGNTSFISLDGKTWNVSDSIVSLKVYTVANVIECNDLEKYYKNASKFSVNVKSANATVTFNINGVNYTRLSDENGTASIAINLRPGNYNITTYFNGLNKTNKITVLSTIIADNLVKYYKNESGFYAKFLNSDGTPLANANVTFNINGVLYTRTTGGYGTAKLNINLNPGNYTLTAYNPVNSQQQGFNILVKSLIEANDLTKYYKNESKFQAKILNRDGSLAINKDVKFNINGVFYTRQTDVNGIVSLAINLNPGNYIITTIFEGLEVSNNINVLPTLITKDLTMSYADGSTFNATVLDSQGKSLANQTIRFNVNGVFYNKITENNGVASLAINLNPGEYIITSIWDEYQTGNKITIS